LLAPHKDKGMSGHSLQIKGQTILFEQAHKLWDGHFHGMARNSWGKFMKNHSSVR